MSAIVCGSKRSFIFEEIPSPSSSSSSNSPVSKRLRCSSFSPPRSSLSHSHINLVDHLAAIFPLMDKKVIEQALENNGHDLDLAIKSLNDLRLGGGADVFSDEQRQSNDQVPVHGDREIGSTNESPFINSAIDGAEWVEIFVREMSAASDFDDAKVRASRALDTFEKIICGRASTEAALNLQQENLVLKEQVQSLLQENGILKRAVSIQHERQKEYETKSRENEHLKHLLTQCQEHIRTLEVNNYALQMHLKQSQQNNNIPGPGRYNPDVF